MLFVCLQSHALCSVCAVMVTLPFILQPEMQFWFWELWGGCASAASRSSSSLSALCLSAVRSGVCEFVTTGSEPDVLGASFHGNVSSNPNPGQERSSKCGQIA